MKIFERLFCKHQYYVIESYLIDAGMNKIFFKRCSKCGKERMETL